VGGHSFVAKDIFVFLVCVCFLGRRQKLMKCKCDTCGTYWLQHNRKVMKRKSSGWDCKVILYVCLVCLYLTNL
jgi:hypothetical protein